MKNVILLIFLFFISYVGYGQTYRFVISGEPYNPSNEPSPTGHVAEVGYYDGPAGTFTGFTTVSTGSGGIWSCSVSIPFKPDILRIRLGNQICFTKYFSGNCYQNNYNDGTSNITFCNTTYQWRGYNISYSPEIIVTTASTNPTSSCDKIILEATPGFPSSVYTWQYQIGTGSWITFANVVNSVQIGIEDISGLIINEAVRFRLLYCSNKSSPILSFSYNKCSPNLLALIPFDTSCSYNNNGYFNVMFDRELISAEGEILTMNLYMGAPPNDPNAILFNESTAAFTPIDVDENGSIDGVGYQWPVGLETNVYYFRYQSFNDGSVYDFGPFNINAPTPVTFTVGWTDVDCYGANTGSISINAGGGQGNYEYSINNGSTWFPFSSATSHNITNLSATTYQVKVKDSNDCIAQQ